MQGNKTLKERIADGVRQQIINGELEPGARLQEVEIAKAYETSRTPVREAFHLLESEGFLEIRPRRGAVVTTVSTKDIREFYELKSLLEGYAARKAVEVLPDEEISRMEALNDRLRECYERGDTAEMVPVHNEFHEVFVSACGNERLAALIKNLVSQFQRFRISLSHQESMEQCIALHDEIIAAFRERDADRVASLVSKNSVQGSELLVKSLHISS